MGSTRICGWVNRLFLKLIYTSYYFALPSQVDI